MVIRGGALARAGKNKNQTPYVEPKETEKKKTGRAKLRSAQLHGVTAMSGSEQIEKQEHAREKQEHNMKRGRGRVKDTRIQNTKKPNNLDYKHITNECRGEVLITSEQLENEGWTIVHNGNNVPNTNTSAEKIA